MHSAETRLTIKELAAELCSVEGKPHSRGFVHAMKHAGFPMPDGKATVGEARAWLAARPAFSWRSVYVTRKYQATQNLPPSPPPKRSFPVRVL